MPFTRLGPDIPVVNVLSMEDVIAQSMSPQAFQFGLAGFLRGARFAARGGWHLRRAVVRGSATSARNWNSDGAWRVTTSDVLKMVVH